MSKISKYIKEVNRLGLHDKILVLRKALSRENRIRYGSAISPNLDSLIESMDFAYPDTWDLLFESEGHHSTIKPGYTEEDIRADRNNNSNYSDITDKRLYIRYRMSVSIIVYFDKIHIVNSSGYEHDIHDLYIRITLRESYLGPEELKIDNFYGTRLSATKEEILAQYHHSHLPGGAYTISESLCKFNAFCLGTGEIRDTLSKLSPYDAGIFKLFLFQLRTYLEWESTEGMPYRHIKNVIGRIEPDALSNDVAVSFFNAIKSYYELKRHEINLNFHLGDGLILIKEDENLENFLKYNGGVADSYPVNIIVTRDDIGHTYSYRKMSNARPTTQYLSSQSDINERMEFYFRGESKTFNVIDSDESIYNREFYIHPKIKYYVKRRIEKRIQEKRLRAGVLKKLNTPAHTS